MRYFEKISFNEFKKDIKNDKDLYDNFVLPNRKTSHSAGYDILSLEDIIIHPGEIKKIPTGCKVFMEDDEVLLIVVRSSMGFKYNVRMCNQVGVIDSDYYNNTDNEGHFYIALQNEGDKDFIIHKGDGIAQGIFVKYLTCDDKVDVKRNGGIGSTNERNDNK